MGIQEVLTYARSVDAASSLRVPGASKERREDVREGDADQFVVSIQAKALYEAERDRNFDVVRERVRLGYYLKKEVLDQVVDAMAREVSAGNMTQATV
jgi:hypothetical protein